MRYSLNKALNAFFFKGALLYLSLTIQADDKDDFVYDLALANQGVSVSQYNTGINYSLGRGIHKETEKSIYWYQRASEQGHSKAPFNLAIVYAKGEGIGQNLPLALEYFKLSAERGNLKAKLFYKSILSLKTESELEALRVMCCPDPMLHGMVDRNKTYK
jgi:hypothetical protein